MVDFLDHLAAADTAIGAHVCTPGVVRFAAGGEVDPVPVAIERPLEGETIERGQFAALKPLAWLPRQLVAALKAGDEIEGEGRLWRVAAKPTRPGDGRWWRAELEDLGPLA